jgi:toxin ParE1/3/4
VSGYVLSPAAQTDIEEIWEYTLTRWGIDQAEVYLRQLKSAIEAIAAEPARGRPCDDVRAGYYKFTVGSHVLFYRLIGGDVDLVRILHRRMDFDRHL